MAELEALLQPLVTEIESNIKAGSDTVTVEGVNITTSEAKRLIKGAKTLMQGNEEDIDICFIPMKLLANSEKYRNIQININNLEK